MGKGSSAYFHILFPNHLLCFCPASWQRAPRKAQIQRVHQPLWFNTAQQQPRAMASVFALQPKLWPPQSSLRWPAKGQNWACPYSRMWSWPHSLSLRADDASPGGEVPSQSSPDQEPREMSSYPLPSALDTAIWGRELRVVSNSQMWGFSHTVMYVDTCTRSLPAPEPHRSFPQRGVSDVPTAKGLYGWSEQSPCPCTCTCLLTLTLALLGFSFSVASCPTKPWMIPSWSLAACHFLLGRGRLELTAYHCWPIPSHPMDSGLHLPVAAYWSHFPLINSS